MIGKDLDEEISLYDVHLGTDRKLNCVQRHRRNGRYYTIVMDDGETHSFLLSNVTSTRFVPLRPGKSREGFFAIYGVNNLQIIARVFDVSTFEGFLNCLHEEK